MTSPSAQTRLLAGPTLSAGAESRRDHLARLGPLPSAAARRDIIPTLEASGLLGRGGAGFPVGRKWRTVAERAAGGTVVLVNGAEGEPLSAKDRALMTLRPNLVLDGAQVAADAVGADEVILYVGSAHVTARWSIEAALAERGGSLTVPTRVVQAPDRYVAGEESAAVHFVNDADARPTTTPPRPFERGIGGRPTLVQNVESIAYAALIARAGDDWYRAAGRADSPGTGLVTVSGVARPGVREIELGATVGEVALAAGAGRDAAPAVLIGGYFGGWATLDEAWDLALDPAGLRAAGRAFGCGVVSFLAPDTCGVTATARIMDYMAGESAAQCGPCVFGLRAIADATARLAGGTAGSDDLARIERWSGQLAGRGACRHPDGAVGLLASALRVFGDEFVRHGAARTCTVGGRRRVAA
ncbi:MAG TPA: NADH-ubiquinone oxidoreductase-F iron-sulfur binding region domain-containing protein [Candidatus Limnocylindrales bacterium]